MRATGTVARHTQASEKTGVEALRGLFAQDVKSVVGERKVEGWVSVCVGLRHLINLFCNTPYFFPASAALSDLRHIY